MEKRATLEAIAEACVAAHKVVMQHGTAEMREATRMLLFAVGRELALREEADKPAEVTDSGSTGFD